MGLRTLAARPRYRAHYESGVAERDTAYHLGTVWPWLMGPFITAYLKVNQRSDSARQQAEAWLAGFAEHMTTTGLGQICEIADAEYPYTPRGCIAQAWSVAEILRAAVEDVYAVQSSSSSEAQLRRANSSLRRRLWSSSPPVTPTVTAPGPSTISPARISSQRVLGCMAQRRAPAL